MEEDDPAEIVRWCTMMRANFGINPTALSEENWAMLFQQAVCLENFRLENMARILAQLFSPADWRITFAERSPGRDI
ncbi:MAG: hypothetical protein K2M37_01825 [Muribaculaceae bacterium]|nr:hypothetical protein [Muribaculaceae bacterium]